MVKTNVKNVVIHRITESDEIKHAGILGMKWGKRRYQNPDGTLTAAGKKRYNKSLEKEETEYGHESPITFRSKLPYRVDANQGIAYKKGATPYNIPGNKSTVSVKKKPEEKKSEEKKTEEKKPEEKKPEEKKPEEKKSEANKSEANKSEEQKLAEIRKWLSEEKKSGEARSEETRSEEKNQDIDEVKSRIERENNESKSKIDLNTKSSEADIARKNAKNDADIRKTDAETKGKELDNKWKEEDRAEKLRIDKIQQDADKWKTASNIAGTTEKVSSIAGTINKNSAKKEAIKKSSEELKSMSNDDIRKRIERMNLERQYISANSDYMSEGRQRMSDILTYAGNVSAVASSAFSIVSLVKELKK